MNSQDDKKRVTPKLRFPEFQTTLGWEASSVSKTCKSFSGGTPNTANKHFYGGKIPFIRSAEIALEKTELFLTEEGLNNSSAKMVNKGDVLVALYGANSGNVALSKIDGAINQAILCLQHQNNNAFLYHILSYNQEKIVNTYIQGGQGNLSGEIIKSIKLPFPSPKEQQKIADCLSSIDELINFREKKIAALKQHKSKQAIVYPKLRFPQFKDCKGWRVMRLGSIFNFFPTNSFSRDKLDERNGTIKNIHYGDIHTKFSALFDIEKESVPFISDAFMKKIRENHYCKEGDLIFADASEDLDDIGKAIEIVNLNNEIMVSGLHTLLARPIESYFSIGFLGHLFQSNLMKKQIQKESQGTKVLGISTKRLNDILVIFPSTQEQQAIADCLSSLDKLISEENEQIGRLKDHKKGLMQQLFPKIQ